jgi:hypothetical protein
LPSPAAINRPNREITERLMVSIRTAEGHMYRACIKVDVADRDELATIDWQDSARIADAAGPFGRNWPRYRLYGFGQSPVLATENE